MATYIYIYYYYIFLYVVTKVTPTNSCTASSSIVLSTRSGSSQASQVVSRAGGYHCVVFASCIHMEVAVPIIVDTDIGDLDDTWALLFLLALKKYANIVLDLLCCNHVHPNEHPLLFFWHSAAC